MKTERRIQVDAVLTACGFYTADTLAETDECCEALASDLVEARAERDVARSMCDEFTTLYNDAEREADTLKTQLAAAEQDGAFVQGGRVNIYEAKTPEELRAAVVALCTATVRIWDTRGMSSYVYAADIAVPPVPVQAPTT